MTPSGRGPPSDSRGQFTIFSSHRYRGRSQEKQGNCKEPILGVVYSVSRLFSPTLLPQVFERRTSTGSEAFSLFICLDATKFVLPSFFSLTKTIYPRVSTKPLPMMQKVHFRLTTVAYELCSLSSLICLTTKKTRMVNPVRTVQY